VIPLDFSGSTVGLVVRRKKNQDHDPSVFQQHADCILPYGDPVGYFHGSVMKRPRPPAVVSSGVGLTIKGQVAYHAEFSEERLFYVDVREARREGVVSTVLVVKVTAKEARLFEEYWEKLRRDPGIFVPGGNNCSTQASAAFVHAGILPRGIPGLDTPNKLYKQIVGTKGREFQSYSGYLGFLPRNGGGCKVVLEPA
jgi:hypothetical protein